MEFGQKKFFVESIYLFSRVFLALSFLNFLAHCIFVCLFTKFFPEKKVIFILYLFFRMMNLRSLSKIHIDQEENHQIVGRNARKLSKLNKQKKENLKLRNMSRNAKKKLLQPKRNNKIMQII